MKKILVSALIAFTSLSLTSIALADTETFQPSPIDIWDLDHYYADKWGIDFGLEDDEYIVEASIFFDNIRNWDNNPNDLYVSLLNEAPTGLSWYYDAGASGNHWASDPDFEVELEHYVNLSSNPTDITYNFTQTEIDLLTLAVSDGNFGLGFDADCHFYNDGISFTVTTARDAVPEPATMLLFGTGLVGLAGLRRKNKK